MHNRPHTDEAKRKISTAKRGVPNLKKRRPSRIVDGAEEWMCPTCLGWFQRHGFYRTKNTVSGITSQCRKCHTAGNLRTRCNDNARDSNRAYMQRARAADPEKFKQREREAAKRRAWTPERAARYLLNRAVRMGVLTRPEACGECGKHGRVQAHHADYGKPLDVEWLCSLCHGNRHRRS